MPLNSESADSCGQIFLVGAFRSGTTMLRLMIAHHPYISFSGGLAYITPVISDTGDFPELEEYYSYLMINRGFLMDNLVINKQLDFTSLCHSFLTQRKKNKETQFMGGTVHLYFNRLPFVWPEGRYIKMIRDGRDVARSFIPMGWAGNVWKGVDHWIESEHQWHKFKSKLPENAWIEIQYEKLLENPEKQLTRLCNFIGVPFREEMLEYHRHTTYSTPDPALAYQWKTKQSETEIRLLESKIGDILEKLGYELSGLPSLEVTPFMKGKLFLQNKIYCNYFHIQRYGLKLSTAEFFTRKLRMKRWHRKLKLSMNEIAIQHLK